MESSKRILLTVIGVAILVIGVVGVAFAFFNYTRTGSANTIQVGRIYFNSEEGQAITLTNLFPIDTTDSNAMNDPTKVGTLTVHITGDTEYSEGSEYLVSAVNVSNTSGSGQGAKRLPISVDVSVTSNTGNNPATTLGNADDSYFTNRGPSASTSIYKVLASDTIESDSDLLVGYIKPGSTGVDGNVVIKAYIDKEKVAISDTYPEQTVRTVKTTGYTAAACETATGLAQGASICASAEALQTELDSGSALTANQISALVAAGLVEEYTDGTTSEWVAGRTVFTTSEWNALQQSGISFQVKVVANEGIWVENSAICKRATTLHTETCSQASYYCYADGYYSGGEMNTTTITYGNLGTSGSIPATGDAFDCNVDGTGYNKRFYYVSNYYDTSTNTFDNTTAVLVYSSNTVYDSNSNSVIDSDGGLEYNSSNNWHGPVTAMANLPTTSQWSNVELKTTERAILACSDADCGGANDPATSTSGGTLPTAFSYSGYAARILTIQELKQSGCDTLSGKSYLSTAGALTACNFLMEGMKYADDSKVTYGTWLETPHTSVSGYVWLMTSSLRKVDNNYTGTNLYGVRPVIDVPMSKIEY